MTTTLAQLTVRIEGQTVQTLAVVQPVVTIGRTPDNTLSLPHPQVARQHAELRVAEEGASLTDLGSAAGTFVGGVPLLAQQPQALAERAIIKIGPFEIIYEGPGTSEDDVFAAAPVVAPAREAEPTQQGVASLAPPRPTYALPAPIGPRSRYVEHLPGVFHDADFLGRYLMIFEALWEPMEQRQDHIAMYIDPATCPVSMLPVLANWLDLHFDDFRQESRQRALLAEAFDLYRWRGTRYGLSRMIELCLGVTPEISEEMNQPFVMRVKVRDSAEHPIDRRLLEETIRAHKPAHIGYILEIA